MEEDDELELKLWISLDLIFSEKEAQNDMIELIENDAELAAAGNEANGLGSDDEIPNRGMAFGSMPSQVM